MTASGRKKLEELYHSVTERSEFYAMADLHKPPVLFSPPAEHVIDKVSHPRRLDPDPIQTICKSNEGRAGSLPHPLSRLRTPDSGTPAAADRRNFSVTMFI